MSGWLLVAQLGVMNALIMLWVVLGFAVTFRLFSFADLTIEASLPLGAGVYAITVTHGHSPWAGAALGMVAGALAGALTATLHVWLRLNKLLAGVIVIAIGYSLTLMIMQGPNIGLVSNASIFGNQTENRILLELLFIAIVAVPLLARFLSGRTGLRMRAAAGNREFAASLGIAPGLQIILAVAGANALAALSGVILTSIQGFADIGMGQGILVMALAALGMGEAVRPLRLLPSHLAVLSSAVIGNLIYQWVLTAAFHLGLPATWLKLATGVLVLVVVAVQALRSPQPIWREVLD